MFFWIYMLLSCLLLPVVMFGIGAYFSNHAPKKINDFFGYRTTRSMKNLDTWKFAHYYVGKLWKIIGVVSTPLTFIAMLLCYGKDIDYISQFGVIVIVVQMIVLIVSIFPVESALKRNFDKHGIRRD